MSLVVPKTLGIHYFIPKEAMAQNCVIACSLEILTPYFKAVPTVGSVDMGK